MMARGPRQRNQYRRRVSGETDYRRRLKLLKSGQPRAVVRISNTRAVCQIVTWDKDGDKEDSKEPRLKKTRKSYSKRRCR